MQLRGANPLAALAPYFLPLWCLILLALGAVVTAELQSVWSLTILFFLGWYLFRLGGEFRFHQTDLLMYGRLFSTLFTALGLLLSVGIILHFRDMLPLTWMANIPSRSLENFSALLTWSGLQSTL